MNQYCASDAFKDRIESPQCLFPLINHSQEFFLKINEKMFYAKDEDIEEAIREYSIVDSERVIDIWKQSQKAKGLYDLMNP